MPSTIRPSTEADIPGLARVRVDTWRAAYRGIVPQAYLDSLDYAVNEQNFQRQMGNLELSSLTALDEGGQPVGYAVAGANRGDLPEFRGEVYAIYILPACQQQGIGRRLLRAAFANLFDRGLFPALIWALEENAACQFYQLVGGVQVGRKQRDIGGKLLEVLCFGFTDPEIWL